MISALNKSIIPLKNHAQNKHSTSQPNFSKNRPVPLGLLSINGITCIIKDSLSTNGIAFFSPQNSFWRPLQSNQKDVFWNRGLYSWTPHLDRAGKVRRHERRRDRITEKANPQDLKGIFLPKVELLWFTCLRDRWPWISGPHLLLIWTFGVSWEALWLPHYHFRPWMF